MAQQTGNPQTNLEIINDGTTETGNGIKKRDNKNDGYSAVVRVVSLRTWGLCCRIPAAGREGASTEAVFTESKDKPGKKKKYTLMFCGSPARPTRMHVKLLYTAAVLISCKTYQQQNRPPYRITS